MSDPSRLRPRPPARPAEPCALQPLGAAAGKQVRHELMRRVRAGEVSYARKLTRSRTVIVLVYAGEEVAFIYSNTSGQPVCFLSPDAPETEDWRQSQPIAQALFPRPAGGYR